MKRQLRDKEEIVKDLNVTYKEYKNLNRGSPAFREVSRKLISLDIELQEVLKNELV